MEHRILLLQIRNLHEIADHEHQCFSVALEEAESVDLRKANVYTDKIDPDEVLEEFDGIIIGGSYHSPKDPFPGRENIEDLIERSLEEEIPYLGVCYGFELLVDILGGKMVQDETRGCFGTEEIKLTEEGQDDVLLSDLPPRFFVQEAHEWIARDLPDVFENLAYSRHVPHQAVKVKEVPAYGVQFHPELNDKEILRRLKLGQKRDEGFDNLEEILKEVKPSPHAVKVVLNFIEKVMGVDIVVE